MRRTVRVTAGALALTAMAGQALAQASCADQDDMTAIRAAAVQQRLMVAALTCNAITLYNQFVVAYQSELQASDRALQNFFRRINRASGTADYHAFKTKLANSSSMQSIGDVQAYCDAAKATFDVALGAAKTSLAVFVTAQPAPADDAALCRGRPAPTIVAQNEAPAARRPAPAARPPAPAARPAPAAAARPAPTTPAPPTVVAELKPAMPEPGAALAPEPAPVLAPEAREPPIGFVGRAFVLRPSARALVVRPLQ